MKIALVCTVLNEEATIAPLLDSILAQTRPPDEVIIVDGGSRDRTVEVLRAYQDRLPLQVLLRPGANISTGRNAAIKAATSEVIACTDAGVRLSPNWLESLAGCFDRRPRPGLACGFFAADPRTAFEAALGATSLPNIDEIDPARFLPSSRSVALLREAWEKVGGYPEWLDYCEDLVFDFKIKRAGYHFAWAPDALAYFRPRSSLRSFFRQYYRYARGDGKADLWRKRHTLRYSTYLSGLIILIAGFSQPWLWLLLLAAAVVYLYRPYRRLFKQMARLSSGQRVAAVLWPPAVLVTGDVAKMIGYPVGVWWKHQKGNQEIRSNTIQR